MKEKNKQSTPGTPAPIPGLWTAITYPASAKNLAPRLLDAHLIDLLPTPSASPFDSAINVERKIAESGGKPLHGWNITQFFSSREQSNLLEAVPRAIWISTDGKAVDVTPNAGSAPKSCFIPASKNWKVFPGGVFFAPAKASPATVLELRQILEAKHVVRKYLQKQNLHAGTPADIDIPALYDYCRKQITEQYFNTVFQFVRYELCKLRIIR